MIKIKTKKIKISRKWLLFAVVLLIFAAATAYAQTSTTPTAGGLATDAFNTAMRSLANLLVAILELLKKILWPIFLLIGGLLNNDLLFGAGMEDRLLLIWTQIRNFINIGFVLILVGVALYNVTGFAKEEYDIKKFIPKFAIALIAVNFSYIGLKLVLDVTNVFTVAIFAMPKTISEDLVRTNTLAAETQPGSGDYFQRCSKEDTSKLGCDTCIEYDASKTCTKKMDVRMQEIVKSVCETLYGKIPTDPNTAKMPLVGSNPEEVYCIVEGSPSQYKLSNAGLKFFSSFTSNNAAMVLAIQFMNIVDVDKVSTSVQSTSGSADFRNILMNLLFSSLFYIIYGVAYVSLFILLLIRLVVLWLIIALSPIIALKLAGLKFAEGGDDYGKMFVQHAVAPIKVAVVLTIGFMMLDAFKILKPNAEALTFGQTIANMQTQLSGISTLQNFVMAAATVIFLWVGIKQATKETKATGIIEGIMNKVQGAGKTVAGMWKYTPIIPTGEGKQSFMQFKGAIAKPLKTLQEKYSGEINEGELKFERIREMAGKRNLTEEQVKNFARELQAGGFATETHTKETQKLLQQWAKAGGQQGKLVEELRRNPELGGFITGGKLKNKVAMTTALGAFAGRAPVGAAPRAGGPAGTRPGAQAAQQPAAPVQSGAPVGSEQAQQAGSLTLARDNNSAAWNSLTNDEKAKVDAMIKERASVANKTGANSTLTDAERTTKLNQLDGKMKTDEAFQKAVVALDVTRDVTAAVTALPDKTIIQGNNKTAFEGALKKATDALKAKKATPDQIKSIIKQTLYKEGVKDDVMKNAKLEKYIQ